jgi:hypothetical protein
MSIETIGEAHSLGWQVIARCTYSRDDGRSSKGMHLPKRTGHGGSVDAGASLPVVALGKPFEMPPMRFSK